jgi:hypothetical protein
MRFSKGNDTHYIEFTTNARRKWTDFKIFRRTPDGRDYGTNVIGYHLVWGCLSLQYGRYACLDCKDTGELDTGDFCQECCDHDYDSSEGMMCINCNAEYPY